MKIGAIVISNNSGLGRLAHDFTHYLPVTKVLVTNHPKGQFKGIFETYGCHVVYSEGAYPSNDEIDRFLNDIDLLMTFETPFNANVYKYCKRRGIKSVCMTMYEVMRDYDFWWRDVDLLLSPSTTDLREVALPNKVYMPVPIDTNRIPFKERTGKELVHIIGYGSVNSRNGTNDIFAMFDKYYQEDLKLIIYSQIDITQEPISSNYLAYDKTDKRINLITQNIPDYRQLYAKGDIFIHPCRFNGLCLPINEALAAGMPVISSDLPAFRDFLPDEWRIKTARTTKLKYMKMIDVIWPDIDDMLAKVKWMHNQDIKELSKQARAIAERFSWNVWRERYLALFESLIS